METELDTCVETLNAVFKRADIRAHAKLKAIPTNHAGDPAIRLIQEGCPPADPFAGLSGRDRRNLGSAFKAAGFNVGEVAGDLAKSNIPAVLFEAFSPPADLYRLARHRAPWEGYLLKPDADFYKTHAETLAEKIAERYATYTPA